jgi:spermidine synthase
VFAMMLAVVLAGIGLGGLAAGWWSRRGWSPGGAARLAAAAGACAVVAGYAGFDWVLFRLASITTESIVPAVLLSLFLMGPVCLLSGVLFTALGAQLRASLADAAQTTGILTLANTLGAMAGSLLAAFVLLPGAGVEGSFFVLALLYGLIALLVPSAPAPWWRRFAPVLAPAAVLLLFPFGQMAEVHYRRVEARWETRLVAAREGISETAFYLAHDFLGEPLHYRLATNAYSMAATSIHSHRYMKLFAFLPAALHPRIERALLICFGVGSTARALADLPDVKQIDIVDVSRDILEMSTIAHPDPKRHPLRDPRVSVHLEDGRFFLQQTAKRYDLITGEPPPPKIAGVAALYSREYFHLVREHLNEGGIATYWIPVGQLRARDALAIIRAFCDAFGDCSLWSGMVEEGLLMGSRGGIAPVPADRFARLWTLPETGSALRSIGLEEPRQLVTNFMADAKVLNELTAKTAPVSDDFPRRISSTLPDTEREALFTWLMDWQKRRERAEASDWLAGVLPQPLARQDDAAWRASGMFDATLNPDLRRKGYNVWADVAELIRGTRLVVLPQWLLDSQARMSEIAARRPKTDAVAAEHLAIEALAKRVPPEPAVDAKDFAAMTPKGQAVTIMRHCLARQTEQARSLMALVPQERRAKEPFRGFAAWAAAECRTD